MTSGDVDVLIGPPLGHEEIHILQRLIEYLTSINFITDRLSSSSEGGSGEIETFMGICKLQTEGSLHRRIDIKVYPRSCFAFAVLYFTGSGHFNRSMRCYASARGFSLSDKGLCKVVRRNKEKVASGPSVICYTEEQIFAALGLEYRSPQERNCYDLHAQYEPHAKDVRSQLQLDF